MLDRVSEDLEHYNSLTELHRCAVWSESWLGAYLGVGVPGLHVPWGALQFFLWIYMISFTSSAQWRLFSVNASATQCGLGLHFVL